MGNLPGGVAGMKITTLVGQLGVPEGKECKNVQPSRHVDFSAPHEQNQGGDMSLENSRSTTPYRARWSLLRVFQSPCCIVFIAFSSFLLGGLP